MAAMGLRGGIVRLLAVVRASLADLFDQRRGFGRLALVHTLQAAGTTLVTVSLAGSLFFSISPHAAESKVLLYLLLTIAPFALVGPALSPLLDRGLRARRASVAVANGGSALLCLAMGQHVHDLLLFPEAFGVLVLGKLYLVTRAALVPALTGDADDLATANARLAVIASIGGFVAFPIGVGLLKLGAPWVLRLAAAVFVVATLVALRLPRPRPRPARGRTGPPPRVAEVRAARRVLGLPLYPVQVRAALGAMSVARATVGFVEFFLAFALRRAHVGTWWFGLLLAASGAGSLLGSLLVPRLRRWLSEGQIITAALVAIALGALAAALIGDLWAQALLTFVVGVGPTSAKPALDSIVQRHVSPVLLGRAFGRQETRLQLFWVVASLAGVVIPFPLWVGDVVVAVAGTLAASTYVTAQLARRRRTAPAPAP